LEVTYVDHIFLEDFNKIDYNPVDILNIFNFKTNIKVKRLEQQTLFPVEELNGNLNLTIRSATRKTDNKKLLYVESTCRGGRGNYTIEKWCDLAHKKLLDLFNEIITEKAKNIWGIIP
jgi:uncharacterized protein (TIGR04255 family)